MTNMGPPRAGVHPPATPGDACDQTCEPALRDLSGKGVPAVEEEVAGGRSEVRPSGAVARESVVFVHCTPTQDYGLPCRDQRARPPSIPNGLSRRKVRSRRA